VICANCLSTFAGHDPELRGIAAGSVEYKDKVVVVGEVAWLDGGAG